MKSKALSDNKLFCSFYEVNLSCVFKVLFLRVCVCSDAEGRSVREFSVDGVYNYSTLLLSPDENKIYVGARENIFSLSLDNISVTYLQKTVSARENVCSSV